jgi:hypothetical protein
MITATITPAAIIGRKNRARITARPGIARLSSTASRSPSAMLVGTVPTVNTAVFWMLVQNSGSPTICR